MQFMMMGGGPEIPPPPPPPEQPPPPAETASNVDSARSSTSKGKKRETRGRKELRASVPQITAPLQIGLNAEESLQVPNSGAGLQI